MLQQDFAKSLDEGELPQLSKEPEGTDGKSRRWGLFSRNAANRTFSEGKVVAREVGIDRAAAYPAGHFRIALKIQLHRAKRNCNKHSTFESLSSFPPSKNHLRLKCTSFMLFKRLPQLQKCTLSYDSCHCCSEIGLPLHHAFWFPKDKAHLHLLVPRDLSRSAACAYIYLSPCLHPVNFDIDPSSVLAVVIPISTEDSLHLCLLPFSSALSSLSIRARRHAQAFRAMVEESRICFFFSDRGLGKPRVR